LTFLSVDLKSKDNTPPWEGEVPMEIGMWLAQWNCKMGGIIS
jgi:hypothetical protein